MGGGPFGQSFSVFLLGMVGEGLGDLRVRGRTSGERSGFFCNGLFTLIFIKTDSYSRTQRERRSIKA